MTDFATILARTPAAIARSASFPAAELGLDRRRAGAGLALSGGGFRAMLFHVGTLRRLHEIGALRHVARVSSVSGGSITAAQLALHWEAIHRPGAGTDRFVELIQEPLVAFASSRLDAFSGITGVLTPRTSIADRVARAYDRFFEGVRLADVPAEPRFVFCATNMGTGSVVRFAKTYTADYRIGKRDHLDLSLGTVVAASAAFPPFLSPMVIELDDESALTQVFDDPPDRDPPPLAGQKPYPHRLELTDGGVYDNLGLQPVDSYHTLMVSDGGGPFQYEDSVAVNWLGHMIRAWKVTDNQVRSLRREGLVSEYKAGIRNGAYWGIGTAYSDYPRQAIVVDSGWASELQSISTRLWPMPDHRRRQLINWAYCLTDAAIRSFVDPALDPPPALPYPDQPLDRPPRAGPRRWWRRALGR